MQDKRVLEIISNDTKEEVCKLDVITPEIFTQVFVEKAKEHNVENVEQFVSDYIHQQIENYLQLQNKTSEHANQLSQTTSKAIDAIKEQDDSALQEVLVQTQELRQEIDSLKESLYKDELTGAYNRKWLHDHLVSENSSQFEKNGVMVLIDLNYFKIINDTYGHIIGDKVLVFITSQLKKTKGKVVRYGGDEFLVFFQQDVTPHTVKQMMQKLREDLLKKHLKAKDAEFRVSFSIGVASFEKGENLDEVIERADTDTYEDKESIKKRIQGISIS